MAHRVLVTGATGFAGRVLVEHLLSQGMDVAGTRYGEIPPDFPDGLIPLIPCDLKDPIDTQKTLSGAKPSRIFHLAAQAAVGLSWQEPGETFRVNSLGTVNLLDGCRALSLETRILLVSSATVYGLPPADGKLVEDMPLRPNDPYGISKAVADQVAALYQETYGLEILRARAFNHIGPGPADKHAIGNFARQVAEREGQGGGEIHVGNLSARRNFNDVRDIVRAYALLMERGRPGEAYNVCGDTVLSVETVLDRLIALSPCPLQKVQVPERMRPVDTPLLDGDNAKLKQATGWKPEIPLDQSLKDLWDYWRGRTKEAPEAQA